MKQRSEAWYQARAGRITGSRFARAMASKRSNAYCGLIDELTQERRTGRSLDGGYVNAAMQWGIDYEDTARRWYGRSRECHVVEAGFVVHAEHDFVGVSPDGLVAHDGLIEIKCPQARGFREVMDSRRIPSRYRWQVQGQLWVCQRQWLDFVCFYPPTQGIVIRTFQDHDDVDKLDNRCREINREVASRLNTKPQAAPARTPNILTTRVPPKPVELPSSSPERPRMIEQQGWPTWIRLLLTIVGLGLVLALFR